MKITLKYFKETGKWYIDEQLDVPDGTPWFRCIEAAKAHISEPGSMVRRNTFDTLVIPFSNEMPDNQDVMHLITYANL